MTEENLTKYNAMVHRINTMPDVEIIQLVQSDQCPFEPEHLIGVALGMFHCEICGEMVVAGFPHPRQSKDQPQDRAKINHEL